MIVYKLTCKTGKIYFGSTKNTLKHRASKGWRCCACKDFDIVKMEVVETVDKKEDLLIRENYYIVNFECVNKNDAIADKERQIQRNKNNTNTKEGNIKWRETVIKEERYKCELCDNCFQSKNKLKRHNEGFRHKLKEESFLKYGDDWKLHYLTDNKQRYNENRKKKVTKNISL